MYKEYYTKEIKSKILGKTLVFGNYGTSYIWVWEEDRPGTLGVQLMYSIGGNKRSPYVCHDEESFTRCCKSWYNIYIKQHKKGE